MHWAKKANFRSPDLSVISRIPHFPIPFRRRVLALLNPTKAWSAS